MDSPESRDQMLMFPHTASLRLLQVLKQRFEKLVGMAPAVVDPNQPSEPESRSMVHDMDHSKLRMSLSPLSSGRAHQLEAPTKKGLQEYDKFMSSMEQSVHKALKTLNSFVDSVKEEEAKRKAKEEVMRKQREKESARRAKALSKDQADGRAEAGKELAGAGEPAADALEDEMDDDEDDEGDECEGWPLVSDANQLLSAPLSNDMCSLFDRAYLWH